MKRFTLNVVVVALGVIFGWSMGAILEAQTVQQKPSAPTAYVPSEVQLLRLQVRQKDAQIALSRAQAAQAMFQQAVAELHGEAERIKTDNGWPKTLTFNPDALAFADAPAASVPAAAPANVPVPPVAKP